MKKLIIAALGVALGVVGVNAYATSTVTGGSSLTVALTLTSACTVTLANAGGTIITSSPALSTGGGVLTATNIGTVSVGDCTTTYLLGADKGGSYGLGTGSARHVTDSTHFVPYTLGVALTTKGGTGTTSAGTILASGADWGSSDMTGLANKTTAGTAASATLSDATAAAPDIYTISAQFAVPATSVAPAGAYTDTVVVGVEF